MVTNTCTHQIVRKLWTSSSYSSIVFAWLGDSALTYCCGKGDVQFIELLVNSGADVNIETHVAKTPLIQAVKAQSIAVVEFLISKQAQVDYTTQIGQTALHWAKRLNLPSVSNPHESASHTH